MRQFVIALSAISLACITSAFAATPVNLRYESALLTTKGSDSFKQISQTIDSNHTKHIRVQQTYAGYSVWGADAVMHVPQTGVKSSMNGMMYRDLAADLGNAPAYLFAPSQAEHALQQGVTLYQDTTGIKKYDLKLAKKNLMVYVDKNNKAHWAFLVSFVANSAEDGLALPTYILDAGTFEKYEQWNDLQTATPVKGGGFGGNQKMGKLAYDGLKDNYPTLSMRRDATKSLCTLQNKDVMVKDNTHSSGPFSSSPVEKFSCKAKSSQHNNIYWNGSKDAFNGAYSPANDALYIGKVIKSMYQEWYGVPVLTFFGMPLQLKMNVHAKDMSGQPMDNAFFFPLTNEMYYGDGVKLFYPLTSLGVGAHEISHGFTSQHSNLVYQTQSGGLNEAYSDMAAQAAEFYSTGKNSWQIGPEIVKGDGALRYMDDPTKDGKSIAHMKDYNDSLNVHYTSGIFNKVFYTLGTTQGWDTRKAFDVMVKANMNYWTSKATFAEAACGVISATKDYHYDTAAVTAAFKVVGLDVSHC